MVAAEEHRYLGAAAGPNLQVEYLAGTHASCLEDETLDRHICRFYQSQLPAGRPDRH
jgi:hypothetical protein